MRTRAILAIALRGPGRVLLLASAAGWLTMMLLVAGTAHDGMKMGHDQQTVAWFAVRWLAMILAMAPPLLLSETGRLWRGSVRRFRQLSIASFLCGYVAIWVLAGPLIAGVSHWATANGERVAVAVALAALWYCSPSRQRWLNACHRVPTLRVFGAAAQFDAVRYGVVTGSCCAAVCGPAMLLVLLASHHHLSVMAVAEALACVERYMAPRRPRWQPPILSRRVPQWADMETIGATS